MDNKIIFCIVVTSLLLISNIGSAANSYLDIQVYYNDVLYPGTSIPKPIVKIGEPFKMRFDVTVNQECMFYAELSDLGTYQGIESFSIIDGPSELGVSHDTYCEKNDSFSYEWILKATDEWAGGSMPIDFYYGILLKGMNEPVVNSEFTAAYVTISDEYYDGPEHIPSSESQSNASSSNSTPGFTMLVASLALLGVILIKRMIR